MIKISRWSILSGWEVCCTGRWNNNISQGICSALNGYEKGYEKSSHKMCIFCAETLKTCAALFENTFYVSANVWLLLDVFQCLLRNGRLLLKDINEWLLLKENVQMIFFMYVDASINISTFFNKRAAACEIY